MDGTRPDLAELVDRKGVLLGCAVDTGVPQLVEIAGRVGYDFIWIDLEHCPRDGSALEAFCMACDLNGALSTMRVADASRKSILHALELGTRIIVIPMVNDAATAAAIVQHGKFAPLGNRGFNGGTRGMQYGLGERARAIEFANNQTHLIPQIETAEALDNLEEIVGVEGITGALVGPGDLSFSLGMPLDFDNPTFLDLYRGAIQRIRACGKFAATATGHPGLLRVALEAGVQLIVGASDVVGARDYMKATRESLWTMAREIQGAHQANHPGIWNSL